MVKQLCIATMAAAGLLAASASWAAPVAGTVSALTVDGSFNVTGMTVDGDAIIGPGVDLTVGTNVRLGAAVGQGPERVITAGATPPATQAVAERLVYDGSLQTGYQDTGTNVNTFNIVFDTPLNNRTDSEFVLLMTTNVGSSEIAVQGLDDALNPIAGQVLNVQLSSLAFTTTFNLGTPPAHQFHNVTGYGGSWSTSYVGNFAQPLARALAVNFDAAVPLGGVQISQIIASSNHIGVEAYGLVPEPSAWALSALAGGIVVAQRQRSRRSKL